jgi:isochorismate synthase
LSTSAACAPLLHPPFGYPALAGGLRRARARGKSILVSSTVAVPALDPLALYAAGSAEERVYWSHPDAAAEGAPARSLAGVGAAWSVTASVDRFQAVRRAWQDLLKEAVVEGAEQAPAWGAGPLALGGFSFDPVRASTPVWQEFAPARFVLPRFTLAARDGQAWLTSNLLLGPMDDADRLASEQDLAARTLLAAAAAVPDPGSRSAPAAGLTPPVDLVPAEAWQDMVASMARDIRQGRFAKVVLARQARVTSHQALSSTATLAALRRAYPGSFVFAFARGLGQRAFLGATPERLVRLRAGLVETSALAGSSRRGASPAEDAQLGETLLRDTKELAEHAVVTEMLRQTLAPLCHDLSLPEGPVLLRLATVQHLFTPIQGRLRNGQTILDLVERLHPTPAVGGTPREGALSAIREREQLDRGWYAGPVGWLDGQGEGEFAVAIRSALLDGARREALLFAGCGIVADSQPEREYAESRLKMQAMLSALR